MMPVFRLAAANGPASDKLTGANVVRVANVSAAGKIRRVCKRRQPETFSCFRLSFDFMA
jgi:hypothetical protein